MRQGSQSCAPASPHTTQRRGSSRSSSTWATLRARLRRERHGFVAELRQLGERLAPGVGGTQVEPERRHEIGRQDAPFEVQAVAMDAYRVDHFQKLEAGGITDMILLPWMFYGTPLRGGTLQSKLDGLRRFADEVIAKMQPTP